ncbi:MAG: hypothetical protein LBM77_13365 [Spirochaetaceae bacterium]|jgi:hypothetical protein|nr:hypothetical protein [Spirochaetaceae bacterium]
MEKQINFEDTIYIINLRVRMLADTIKLEGDPGFFLAITEKDLDFCGAALDALLTQLEMSEHYFDKEAQFHNLVETEEAYQAVLHSLSENDNYKACQSLALKLLRSSEERKSKLDEAALAMAGSSVQEPLVSSTEISELLRGLAVPDSESE